MYYFCGLVRHGLRKLLLYIGICKGGNTSIIHRCLKNNYNNYHRIIVIKLIERRQLVQIRFKMVHGLNHKKQTLT